MPRVSDTDLRAIFGFLANAQPGGRWDPVPASTLGALRDLVGADSADYFELRRSDRALLGFAESDTIIAAPGSEESIHAFGHQNPVGWRRWMPAHGALRLSELVRRREFEQTEFYDGFMRPNGLRDALKVWLWRSSESVACIQLWRGGFDFSRRDRDVMSVLHHHLIALRAVALRESIGSTVDAGLTVREAEVITWAARGESETGIASRLGIAPGTVNKHLEHAYERLGVHSRTQAIGQILFRGTDD